MREVLTLTIKVDPDAMITEARLGYTAPDYDNLKVSLMRYFSDRDALTRDALGARRFATERFSMSNAALLLQFIENLLQRKQ